MEELTLGFAHSFVTNKHDLIFFGKGANFVIIFDNKIRDCSQPFPGARINRKQAMSLIKFLLDYFTLPEEKEEKEEKFFYCPDTVSAPGETLNDILKERNIDLIGFCSISDIPLAIVEKIIQGEHEITLEIANKLEEALGVTSGFWINREKNYRDFIFKLDEALKNKFNNPGE